MKDRLRERERGGMERKKTRDYLTGGNDRLRRIFNNFKGKARNNEAKFLTDDSNRRKGM